MKSNVVSQNCPCHAESLVSLIYNVLDFSKVETGNLMMFPHKGKMAVFVKVVEDPAQMLDDSLQESSRTLLLRFSVRDTGIGILEDKIELLFEKFAQADAGDDTAIPWHRPWFKTTGGTDGRRN